MKKWVLAFLALGALAITSAIASDLTISTATTEPVETVAAANETPGDITITTTGSIELGVLDVPEGELVTPPAVPAITLNSNNSVTNNGSIIVRHFQDPVGILIEGGHFGAVANNGTILVEGSDDGIATTTSDIFSTVNSIGILLNDVGTFTGNFVTGADSSITARGQSPTGIYIQSAISGNVLLDGNVMSMGNGAIGVRSIAPISGTFHNSGSIVSAPRDDGDGTTRPTMPGSALTIGASVGAGILNNGPNDDTTPVAQISTMGSAPALRITPATGVAADITIGTFSDIALSQFSVVNRGEVVAAPIWPNTNANSIVIGGSGDFATILAGDFYNSGTIRALSTSDNANATSSVPSASDSTAILLDANSVIPELENTESGVIEAMTDGPFGGNATAIEIGASGSLSSLINDGSIIAKAFATLEETSGLDAYVIRDRSGTLTNVVNNGTISASASGTNTLTIAADLTRATTPINFVNTGTVVGDVLFGTGATPSTLSINGPEASVSGFISSGGTVDISVSEDGSGGTLITSGVRNGGTFIVGPGGVVGLDIGKDPGPLIEASGVASFDEGSSLFLNPVSFLAEQRYELVAADGGLTIANGVTDGTNIPFLFNGFFGVVENPNSDQASLVLDVALKSTEELGLTENGAAMFQGVAQAALRDDELGAELLSLGSNDAVANAIEQFVPNDRSVSRAVGLMITDPARGNVAGRQRRMLMHPDAIGDGGAWMVGGYNVFDRSGEGGYDGNGLTGTLGLDFGERGAGHLGIAYSFFHGGADGTGVAMRTTDVDWNIFTMYMGIERENKFANAQINVGVADVEGMRQVNIGNVSRTARSHDWTEILASGNVSAGLLLDLGDFQLAPQLGIDYASLNRSNYTERNGGDGVNLEVQDSQDNFLRGYIGASLGGVIDGGGVSILPQAYGGIQHDFLNDGEAIVAGFESVPGNSFTTFGPQAGTTGFVGGIGVDVSMGWWAVGAYYDAIIRSDETVHSAHGNLYIRF